MAAVLVLFVRTKR